ncbi:4-oxalocrotonate tautomerase family protein [Trinickia violacea]|uniref:4-oxalocrotonate tautomerase family protein n=1 Tax=Trinickia violacea TaxID=2571746 RepID=A0A4P8INH2_9BURK|nr:4-oxalocrotonate tautomerase family protein [Trinickia violacea]QCP49075.1 4-oxalocrotonate tautomerase family protein [Trinickia violacea]
MPVVRVSWFEGKTETAKAEIAAEITESLFRNARVDPKYTYVIFEDCSPANWAIGGELFQRGDADD